ncbi:MAG: hypothetical protein U5K32_12930 [Bacteroidales bacterium]|nr:hypothetical protein [Bacteroidales bacterium]
MKKFDMALNDKLKFELSRLSIDGSNIDEFYKYRLELFLLENSELSNRDKFEALLPVS